MPSSGSWPFADIEEMMREVQKEFEEHFKEIEKDAPKSLVRERSLPDGSVRREIGPIVFGYTMTVGPDGKPVIREFGNVKRGASQPWKELQDAREPLVDVVTSDKDVKVIAELPGVKKEDIQVIVDERRVTISVDSADRKYHKELELPEPVNSLGASSKYNNGILEITVPKKTSGPAGTKLRVD
jgi:HSP20 family protein